MHTAKAVLRYQGCRQFSSHLFDIQNLFIALMSSILYQKIELGSTISETLYLIISYKNNINFCKNMILNIFIVNLSSIHNQKGIIHWRCRGLNPGPFTCKANALPLRYIPYDDYVYNLEYPSFHSQYVKKTNKFLSFDYLQMSS